MKWAALHLSDIAQWLGLALPGPDRPVSRLAALGDADDTCVSFLSNPRYLSQLHATRAAAVLVSPKLASQCPAGTQALVVPDPYLAYARVATLWQRRSTPLAAPGVHASAEVEPGAVVHPTATIGAHCSIGPEVVIGADSVIHPGVTIYGPVVLGDRCVVHAGVVIGADGFGFAPDGGRWVKIPQLGGVRIGDDVEIGANTTIDRGALADTVIEDGVKLDNQIQIAHNVRIGRDTAIAACVGIAGSTVIGARCTIGGAAGIIGHLHIADDVHIAAFSLVSHSIATPGEYAGVFPLDDKASWEKNAASLRQLNALRLRLKHLERTINPAKP